MLTYPLLAALAFPPVHDVEGDEVLFHPPVALTAAGEVIDAGPEWGHCGPTVHDVDGDGVRDLLVGDFSGKFRLYRNEGTDREPRYAAGTWLRVASGIAEVPIY